MGRFFSLIGALFLIMTTSTAEAKDLENQLYIDLKDGRVVIDLLPNIAPQHVDRIKELTREGFYNGIVFHRVIEGFMAQTGDPTGTGTGGSGEKLRSEFSDEPFVRGTVGMARSQNPHSGDSQFFICFNGCSHLTGQYTVWGQVVSGMETIEKLAIGEPPSSPDKMISVKIGKK